MAQLRIVIEMGDQVFHVKGITLKEMLQVKSWTNGEYSNLTEFRTALSADDPEALQAAYALAIWRETDEKPRLVDLDFDLDTQNTFLADEDGRPIEMVFETKADGSLKLDKDKKPSLVLNEDGTPKLRFADTGEEVPPTETPTKS